MSGFDFTRPFKVVARSVFRRDVALGLGLALAVRSAPWAYRGAEQVMSDHHWGVYGRMVAEFDARAALPDGAGTCFGQQAQGMMDEDNIKASTVMISVGKSNGQGQYSVEWTGTGFVVADSSEGHGSNRIVTAGHVVTQYSGAIGAALGQSMAIFVYASDGHQIGKASVAAISRSDVMIPERKTVTNLDGLLPGDVAVLHVEHFYHDSKVGFDRIRGLDLAKTPGHGFLKGQAGEATPGVNSGQSGAPVIDAVGGGVVGVAVQADASGYMVHYHPGQIWNNGDDSEASHPLLVDESFLAAHNAFITETLSDNILGVLGPQGGRVLAARAQGGLANPEYAHVLIPGMPADACVVVQGSTGPVRAFATTHVLDGPQVASSSPHPGAGG